MNEVQNFLLKMVEEIDQICLKHHIDYYIFAGSMLGVERNEGFLPWDDDMDIVMTKANYDKFKEVLKTELPPNRVFEDKENCPDYPLHFGKYTSTDSASIIRSLAFGDCTAGFWIDVMYVAPMPVDEKKRKKVQRLFPLLCELENEFYIEYAYRYKGFYRRYKLCLMLSRLIGKKPILRYLHRQCDHYPEDECKDYFLYHSLDADFRVYSKACFQKPIRTKFEGGVLNKSPANRKMCREAYGDGWMMVPSSENQAVHSTITSCDVPYLQYKADYMQFIDHDEVMRDFNAIKEMHMKKVHKERVSLDAFYRLEAQNVSMKTIKGIQDYEIPMATLIEEKRYAEIGNLFDSYIRLQWKPRMKNNHIAIPLPDEYLYGLLLYLICERQEFYSAAKLLSLHQEEWKRKPEWLDEIQLLLELSEELSVALWDEEDYERVLYLCEENRGTVEKYGLKDFRQAYCIALTKMCPEERDEAEASCTELHQDGDNTGIALKLLGDIYLDRGRKELAALFYQLSKKKLRNGLLLLEIEQNIKGMSHE